MPATLSSAPATRSKEIQGDQPLSFLRTISSKRLPHVNRGALFGLGNADNENGGWNTFFACISVAAALFIVFWPVASGRAAQDRFLCLALGMILAGMLGNLYDRIGLSGVRFPALLPQLRRRKAR